MGAVTSFVNCFTPLSKIMTTKQKAAFGIDIILGVALTAIALYALFSGRLPQGTSQIMLTAGATYLGLMLMKALVMFKHGVDAYMKERELDKYRHSVERDDSGEKID